MSPTIKIIPNRDPRRSIPGISSGLIGFDVESPDKTTMYFWEEYNAADDAALKRIEAKRKNGLYFIVEATIGGQTHKGDFETALQATERCCILAEAEAQRMQTEYQQKGEEAEIKRLFPLKVR